MAGASFFEGRFKPLADLFSVPGFLVILAWLMLALSAVVLLGTMWPVISKLWSQNPVGLDAGFYNRVCLPLFALVTCLVAFCPILSWTTGVRDKAGLGIAFGALVGGGLLLFSLGLRLPVPLFAGAAAVAAMATACYVFVRQRHARSRAGALGAYCVHVGLALLTLGVAFSGPYQQTQEAVLTPGRAMEIGGFTLTYKDLEQEQTPAVSIARARIEVTKGGHPVGSLTPERRIYRGFEQPFAEVSTIPSLGDELYATLLSSTDKKVASIKISVNPLVNWVWIGGTIMFPVLRERRGQMGGTLSGGEQQMLAIGRALLARPKLLLLDEPSLGLAPLVVENIFEIIKQINRDGVTVLLVEQNAQMALQTAHRGYVLETGRVTLEGAAHDLLNDPKVRSAYLGLD